MIRLIAYVSGRVQRVGYRAKVISLAKEMGLVGFVQNRPDDSVLVIAEGEKKDDLERFASAIAIKNALIDVKSVGAEYTQGTGQYSSFKKITGPDEVGERLDDGIEILKRMLDKQDETIEAIHDLTAITKDLAVTTKDLGATTKDIATTIRDLTTITKEGLGKQDQALGKMDQMLDKQDETTEAIRDLKRSDERFVRMEKDIRTIKSKLSIR